MPTFSTRANLSLISIGYRLSLFDLRAKIKKVRRVCKIYRGKSEVRAFDISSSRELFAVTVATNEAFYNAILIFRATEIRVSRFAFDVSLPRRNEAFVGKSYLESSLLRFYRLLAVCRVPGATFATRIVRASVTGCTKPHRKIVSFAVKRRRRNAQRRESGERVGAGIFVLT